MNKVNKVLLMIIAMVIIMIAAVSIDKGVKIYEAKQWEKQSAERYAQARAQVSEMTVEISQLSEDPAAVQAYIEEKVAGVDEFAESKPSEEQQADISGNEITNQDVSGNDIPENTVSGDDIEDSVSDNSVSGNDENGSSVSDNTISDNSISGNSISDNSVSDNSVSGNELDSETGEHELTLKEKREIMGSYQQTLLVNETDKKTIEESNYDFSNIKIACLGDSITAASNLDSEENYQQYSYPTQLKEVLGAESVTNLGIGGSSIGRYWDNAFVDRYQKIPEDTDLIIVMGGTNDGFCVTEEEIGNMQERASRTFIGDLDQLMQGLQEDYPEATIVFATPLPNVLHDILRKERDYLLPQTRLVEIIKELAAEYDYPVIDMYNSNILDTHDAAVISNFMPDGVHGNPKGYEIMAEHFGAELIQIYEEKENEVNDAGSLQTVQ